MKQLLPILLVLFCYACHDATTPEIPYTIIKGNVQLPPIRTEANIRNHPGYLQSLEDRQLIKLVSNALRNGIEEPNHITKIDAAGNYEFKLPITDKTEVRIIHLRNQLPLMVYPNEELTVNFHFVNQKEWGGQQFEVLGKSADISQEMIAYNEVFKDSFLVELNATLTYFIPNEFKTQRSKIAQRIIQFSQNYIHENAPKNEILANWIKHHTDYRIGMDYLKYAFKIYRIGQFSPDLKENFPESFFDFWETYPVENPSALTSLNYQNYLQLYQKYLFAKLRNTTPYQDCLKFPNCNAFEMEVAQIKANLSGETKNIVLAQQLDYHLIRNSSAFIKNGYPLFLAAISDSLKLAEVIARKDFLYEDRPFDYPENASLIQSDATGEEILNMIAQKHPNRRTILYFWNTQRPITYAYRGRDNLEKSLYKLDSMNYDLVMLAHHSTPNIWKEQIVNLGLTGDQWHLNDEQFTYFYNYFQANRKPHPNYDRILDHENFLLLIDDNRNLATFNSISFRENNFVYLNSLNYMMKYHEIHSEKNRIKVGG